MYQVNEHDEFELTVTFRTAAGVLAAPTTISYRIDAADGTEILDDTAVTPTATSVVLTLGYDANAILDDTLEFEDHVVTLTAGYGTDGNGDPRQVTRQFQYQVKNLEQLV